MKRVTVMEGRWEFEAQDVKLTQEQGQPRFDIATTDGRNLHLYPGLFPVLVEDDAQPRPLRAEDPGPRG